MTCVSLHAKRDLPISIPRWLSRDDTLTLHFKPQPTSLSHPASKMTDNDITDLLTNTFTSLQLFAAPPKETPGRFDLFSELPIELRLKVFKHALPVPSVIDVNARIVVSDPSFGLYITFSIPTVRPMKGNPGRNLTSISERRTPKQTRILSLLAATRESRDAYLSVYNIALPYDLPQGSSRRGTLYVSKQEVLHLDKLDDIIIDLDFQRAIRLNYQLQDFWGQIETLALPIGCFVLGEHESGQCKGVLRLICLKLTGLKSVKGVMWKGFQELQEGAGKDMMERSMKRFMAATETALKDHEVETNGYKVPSFDLIV